MKILFLLFPLILLLVQGAAGIGLNCWQQGGFCSSLVCPSGTKVVGSCRPSIMCCKK
ncbi:AMP1 protein, partial [Donacobius atricapilla]|nr:AMP1 protein [Donacobius atricapilla]